MYYKINGARSSGMGGRLTDKGVWIENNKRFKKDDANPETGRSNGHGVSPLAETRCPVSGFGNRTSRDQNSLGRRSCSQRRQHQAAQKIQQFMRQSKNHT